MIWIHMMLHLMKLAYYDRNQCMAWVSWHIVSLMLSHCIQCIYTQVGTITFSFIMIYWSSCIHHVNSIAFLQYLVLLRAFYVIIKQINNINMNRCVYLLKSFSRNLYNEIRQIQNNLIWNKNRGVSDKIQIKICTDKWT